MMKYIAGSIAMFIYWAVSATPVSIADLFMSYWIGYLVYHHYCGAGTKGRGI